MDMDMEKVLTHFSLFSGTFISWRRGARDEKRGDGKTKFVYLVGLREKTKRSFPSFLLLPLNHRLYDLSLDGRLRSNRRSMQAMDMG